VLYAQGIFAPAAFALLGEPPSPGESAIATLAPMAVSLLLCWAWVALCVRRVDRTGSYAAVRSAERAVALARWLALGAHAMGVVVGGWGGAVSDATGGVPVLDPLLAVAPVLLVIVLSWAILWPIERRVHDAMTIRILDQGGALRGPWTLGAFIWSNIRHQMLIALAPLTLMMAWSAGARGLFTWAESRPGALPAWLSSLSEPGSWAQGAVEIAGVLGVLLVTPAILSRVWDTVPLREGPLFDLLDSMYRRHGVKVGRSLVWRTHGMMINGAVMGLVYPARYVLLTDGLLERLNEKQVEAVSAHEIGHVRRRHMLWLGVLVLAAVLLSSLISSIALHGAWWALGALAGMAAPEGLPRQQVSPHALPALFEGVIALVSLVSAVMVFGLASRRFEWQADAFAVQHLSGAVPHRRAGAGVIEPAAVEAMASALEAVARHNAIPLDRFTFRHGTIRARILRLRQLAGQPAHALPIDRQVRRWQLAGAMAILIVILAGILLPMIFGEIARAWSVW
jgi:Zn-dependent protease with chaperone function